MVTQIRISENVIQCQSDAALVNGVIIDRGDHLVVVDTMLRPQDSRQMKEIATGMEKPVRFVVNTHWHSDHCYGNRFLAGEHTTVIAQEQYLDTITSERYVISPDRRKIVEKKHLLHPGVTFTDALILPGTPELRLMHAPGHTIDSIVVFIEAEKVLIAGDNVLHTKGDKVAVPYFFWGDSDLMQFTLERLLMLDVDTVIPGHGDPVPNGKIAEEVTYLKNLKHLFNQWVGQSPQPDPASAVGQLVTAIPATACLDAYQPEDFWVPRMHELNLEKLFRELFPESLKEPEAAQDS